MLEQSENSGLNLLDDSVLQEAETIFCRPNLKPELDPLSLLQLIENIGKGRKIKFEEVMGTLDLAYEQLHTMPTVRHASVETSHKITVVGRTSGTSGFLRIVESLGQRFFSLHLSHFR